MFEVDYATVVRPGCWRREGLLGPFGDLSVLFGGGERHRRTMLNLTVVS